MKEKRFEDLLIHELEDLYDAEKQLVEALPLMEQAASTSELKKAFRDHLQDTRRQVIRLEKIFKMLGADCVGITCDAMKGLIKEGSEIINMESPATIKDAALIGAAQKIEHYEIAGYGTARAHAKILEMDEVVDLLHATLEEEGAADKKLSRIAEGSFFRTGINQKALKS